MAAAKIAVDTASRRRDASGTAPACGAGRSASGTISVSAPENESCSSAAIVSASSSVSQLSASSSASSRAASSRSRPGRMIIVGWSAASVSSGRLSTVVSSTSK